MAITRTRAGHSRNAAGTARPSIAGGDNVELTALDALAPQMFTTVSGLTVELTDGTTTTIQSDSDGFTLDEIETGYGQLQNQTFTLSEMKDDQGNAPFIQGLKRNIPYSLSVPEGRDRVLTEPYSGRSFEVVDRFFIQGIAQDDDSNPRDGDVGNPNTISITCRMHGRNYHKVRRLDLLSTGVTFSSPIVAAAYTENRSLGGGIGRTWVMIEDGASSSKPAFHIRDEYGNWSKHEFGANDDHPEGCAISGTYAITVVGASTVAINLEDTSSITTVAHTGGTLNSTNVIGQGVYAHSPTEIFVFAGTKDLNTTASHARVVKMTSPLGKSTAVSGTSVSGGGNGTAGTGSQWNDMHGRGDELVVVGQKGSATNSTWTNMAKYSDNRGATFTDLTLPTGASTVITACYISAPNTIWIGDSAGKLFWTYNKGSSWQEVSVEGVTSAGIQAIRFVEPKGGGADQPSSRVGYVFGTYGSSTKQMYIARTMDHGNRFVTGSGFSNLISSNGSYGTAHANTAWGRPAVADAQTMLAVGAQGASGGFAQIAELE